MKKSELKTLIKEIIIEENSEEQLMRKIDNLRDLINYQFGYMKSIPKEIHDIKIMISKIGKG